MDEILREAIKQSPTLGLMLMLVMAFLKHVKDITTSNGETQQRMMESHAKRTDEFITTVKDVRGEFIAAVKEMKEEDRESRDRNSEALTNLGTEITRLSTIAENHRNGS